MRGLIFNIQRYSIHDGGGIRTLVFFKGCPLTCPWCCNPESQSFQPEVMKMETQCIQCGICSNDPKECPSGALVEQGRWMTVDEVLTEVLKDEVFYNTSQGGVTLSGGEVLCQGEFAIELLRRLRRLCITTAIETSGAGEWSTLLSMAQNTDVILYDLKIIDRQVSKAVIGIDSSIILENFEKLISAGFYVIPRIPLIPGYTMTDENLDAIIKVVLKNKCSEIHLLPFHQYGSSKYKNLGRGYLLEELKIPSDKDIQSIRQKMERAGLAVTIGGV